MQYTKSTSGYTYRNGNLYEVKVIKQVIKRENVESVPATTLLVETGDGQRFTIGLSELYTSVGSYEQNQPVPYCEENNDDVFRLPGPIAIEYYIVENSQVKRIMTKDIWLTLVAENKAGQFIFKCPNLPDKLYESEEHARSFNEVEVVDEDGTHRKEVGGAILARLEDDQRAVIEELKSVLAKVKDNQIRLCVETEEGNLYAFNMRNGDVFSSYDSSYNEDTDEDKVVYVYGNDEFRFDGGLYLHYPEEDILIRPKKEETAE